MDEITLPSDLSLEAVGVDFVLSIPQIKRMSPWMAGLGGGVNQMWLCDFGQDNNLHLKIRSET